MARKRKSSSSHAPSGVTLGSVTKGLHVEPSFRVRVLNLLLSFLPVTLARETEELIQVYSQRDTFLYRKKSSCVLNHLRLHHVPRPSRNSGITPDDLVLVGETRQRTTGGEADKLSAELRKDFVPPCVASLSGDKDAELARCGRCKSTNIKTTQGQTRSADEGMTEFYECKDCGLRWKN